MPESNSNLKPAIVSSSLSRHSGKLRANHSVEKSLEIDLLCSPLAPSSKADTTEIAVLTKLEQLDSLLPEWRELYSGMLATGLQESHAPPFSRPDVLVCWAKAAPAEIDSLFIVTLRNRGEGKLLAVFPGFLYRNTVRMLTDVVTDYQDITALSNDDAVVLMGGVTEITQDRKYRLAFHKVSDSSLLWAWRLTLDHAVHSFVKRPHGPCPYGDFEIPRGGNDFLGALSRKRRKNHKAAASKIRQGIPEGKVEHLRGEEITRELIEEIANLHIKNQYRKSGKSIFENQSIRDWLLRLSGVDSGLCLTLFRDGDELAAFNLSFVDVEQKAFYYYIPVLSDKYLNYSLGTWLLVESLRHHAPAVGGSFRLDLLCGDEEYKKMWSTNRYYIWRLILFPEGISHRPMYYLYHSVFALKALKNKVINIGGNLTR